VNVEAFVRSEPAHRNRGPVNPVLCVHNLSRLAQPAELHVEHWVGRQPIELLGRVAFPLIGSEPYPVTLAPYGSHCFELA
jgi:maltose alpha-D-glucosyltransferase/alpha-amylase